MRRAWWFLAVVGLATWGCGPPEIVQVVMPGSQPVRQVIEGQESQALGEQAQRGAVQPPGADVIDTSITTLEATQPGETRTIGNGLAYTTLQPGSGAEARPGKMVRVHYVGTMTNGTKFESSRDTGQPAGFLLGAGRMIRGWDLGISGMRVGEVRKLTVPPQLAYGAQGKGVIPPNATLVFEIELLGVQ
jgi:FKBP-type peptidyl-prolyl cis-trans isomerase